MKQMKKRPWGKKLFFSFLLLSCMSLSGFAQNVITGKVIDESGMVIPGATILVKGTTKGTVSDFDGNYTLEATSEDNLIFSYIGYKTIEIKVGTQTTVNVTLTEDTSELEEVVVVGYGTVKKSDVVGSVSQVTSKSFEDQPLTRTEDALQGRASGVKVTRSSGQPGGSIKVRIRGVNSITGNNSPLIVIDGVIGGDLSTINPSDIEAMDVLKDASATAIYGSRGSNGVILVTTKKGRGKAKISFDSFVSFDNIPELLPTLGAADFARIENSSRARVGSPAIYSDAEIAFFEENGGTNYQEELFDQQGMTQNFQMTASGGSENGNINYFLSGNYVKQTGMVIETGYEKYSLRSNLDAKISDKFEIGLNLSLVRDETENDLNSFSLFNGRKIMQAATWDPTTPVYNDSGEYNYFSLKSVASGTINPIAEMRESQINFLRNRVDINLNAKYDFTDNLSYALIVGANTVNTKQERYDISISKPDATYSGTDNTSYQISNILTWSNTYGKHNINATGLYEFSSSEYSQNGYSAYDYLISGSFYLAELAESFAASNIYNKSDIQSVMARAAYVYDESLFLTATIRMDQSSRFRKDENTGYFPSLALKYSFKKWNFIENGNFLSDLAIRAGWGQVGNQNIAPYSTFPSSQIGGTDASYPFTGGTPSPGAVPEGYGNEDLTWETTTQTNVGLDLAFWNGRANFTIDGYKKNTTDLLLNVPVPGTNGGGFIPQNIGEVENYGYDITLGGYIISNDNFNWESNVNFSYVRNEVVDLGEEDFIQGSFEATDGTQSYWNIIEKGEPLGQFLGATFLGTWKTSEATEAAQFGRAPGDPKYLRDDSGEIVYQAIGNGTPTTFWGFNNTFSYKNWDLNLLIQGVHGFEVYNTMRGTINGPQRSFMSPDQLNQWTPQNETDIPAGGQSIIGSSRFVENGSFVRLQNLAIGYTLREIGPIESLRLYASGQNLFLITDYQGYDPELNTITAVPEDRGNGDVAAGIDAGAYPNPRTFTLGCKLNF
ncbi:TonB-dependent receptor [Tamlana sp. 2_MG-2023]|uniref:SusC/RagA family TonB-linked outer membrane protein n=1 Tax=unclassified Tamlana TaxID=2614803 RepID=UPI0026E2B385|nr:MULTISPECIES: TonB-dependent receptor [unclassified Tamlana]MDO6761290.1 TonB-dependent receptor [Tamlana sp. 2_MG-2023]MDO6791773.1 TonB-dependent receptor [Tamlana sp. 1_MG-2023]